MPENTILHSPTLNNDTILLDTSSFIEASRNADFRQLLRQWQKHGCELFTLPEVNHEFVRGMTGNYEEYTAAHSFIESLGVAVMNLDRLLNERTLNLVRKFTFHYSRAAKQASLADYKLCLALCIFPNLKLISGNSRDIPTKLFDRVGIIVIDHGTGVHSEMVYQFNESRFSRLAPKIKS